MVEDMVQNNSTLLEALVSAGDRLEGEREVEHFFYGRGSFYRRRRGDVAGLVAALQLQGYAPVVNRRAFRTGVLATRLQVLRLTELNHQVQELAVLGASHQFAYDGWGCGLAD